MENTVPETPNLLIIHTDQQSCWSIGAYGGTLVETPHIDSLVRNGAIFRQFFTVSAVCTPSRGCFLTGRYPHSHGAYTNNLPLNRDEMTVARVLQQHGYETGYAGKWHLDGEPRPGWMEADRAMGFGDCRYMFNRGHWKQITDSPDGRPTVSPYQVIGDEKTYTTDWLTDKTIEFIERHRDRPFCFMVSIPDPHHPHWVRPPYDTMFDPKDMPLPSTFWEDGIPSWAEAHRESGMFPFSDPNREDKLRTEKALYCGEVKCIDDNVGRIVQCLQNQGTLNHTIIAFTSDHGEYMGEHGLFGKNELYETAYRVPLIIHAPGRIALNTAIDRIVSTVDFQQTVLGLMGIAPSEREQGRDASPLLYGEDVQWQDEVFIHHSSLQRAGLFTPEYELAYVKGGQSILFDRINDPEQANNLFHDSAYRTVIAELTGRIIQHHRDVSSPALDWLEALSESGA